MSKVKCVEVLASGKVLITGGYLIIDPDNCGLVLSTNTKFSCTIQSIDRKDQLQVVCPQIGLESTYSDSIDQLNGNPFIDKCIKFIQ